jgi:hypothetical protein
VWPMNIHTLQCSQGLDWPQAHFISHFCQAASELACIFLGTVCSEGRAEAVWLEGTSQVGKLTGTQLSLPLSLLCSLGSSF